MIELANAPIDVDRVLRAVQSPAAGAAVLFLGTARQETGGRRTASLDYQCYPEMAEKQLGDLEIEARERWPLIECSMVHRLGRLEIGEVAVAVAVSAAHRQPAFEAGQWLIDQIKCIVPIWKRENWADGESQWIHPGLETPPTAARNSPS
ncbi:MAG: molybdenum cofactor biosynthesis protein MoaE [Rhodopirellula sp.]|nr:molybdenum cofactor biosynthesis protein MoaE [Rhodopirellula sp.]